MGPLADARRLFQLLADSGLAVARRMVAVALGEAGDCFLLLRRLDEAEAALSECQSMLQKMADVRSTVVYKAGIAKVRDCQHRYDEAVALYREVRDIYTALGEPGRVGIAWYQIGIVCEHARWLSQAEDAYRRSLAIAVQERNLANEANSLSQLGNVYGQMGRLQEAIEWYRQAANVHSRLQDPLNEGYVRSNLAKTLVKLRRYNEAQPEVQRAIECRRRRTAMPPTHGKRTGFLRMLNGVSAMPVPHWPPATEQSKLISPIAGAVGKAAAILSSGSELSPKPSRRTTHGKPKRSLTRLRDDAACPPSPTP